MKNINSVITKKIIMLKTFLLIVLLTLSSFSYAKDYVQKDQIFGDPAVGCEFGPLYGCGFGNGVALTHAQNGDYLIAYDNHATPADALVFFKRDPIADKWMQMQPSYRPSSDLCTSGQQCMAGFHAASGPWAMVYNGDGLAIFHLNPGANPEWVLSQTITRDELPLPMAPDGFVGEGITVSLDGKNGIAMFGVPSAIVNNNSDAGAVYVLELDNSSSSGRWVITQTITDPRGISAPSRFGARHLSVSGKYAMIRATGADSDNALRVVLVYKRNPDKTWSHIQTLKANAPDTENLFGFPTILSDKYAIINGGNFDSQKAYFYSLDNGGTFVLTQPPIALGDVTISQGFNFALNGKTAAIGAEDIIFGAQGQVKIFRLNDKSKTWQVDQIIPAIADIPGASLALGISVSLSDKYLAAGASTDNIIPVPSNPPYIGRVFIYGNDTGNAN